MKIKVVDSFGIHVGDAEVTWQEAAYAPGTGFQDVQDEVNQIFPEAEFTVMVPTRNAALPWRFEVSR